MGTQGEGAIFYMDNIFAGIRILVAEKDKRNRRSLCKLLENTGIVYSVAVNGREAVEAFHRASFDIVLLDLDSQLVDAIEAANAIRILSGDRNQETILVALSGDSMGILETKELFDETIFKPYTSYKLLKILYDVFGVSHSTEQSESRIMNV